MTTPTAPRPLPDAYRFSWRSLPRDIKMLAISFIVVMLAGIAWLFTPWRPKPIAPLLGWSEPTAAPTPRPTATPRPTPTRRPPPGQNPSPTPSPKKGFWPW